MAKTKYMVTSGFLGAGKTTSMLALAREINARWGKAAILANDLGAGQHSGRGLHRDERGAHDQHRRQLHLLPAREPGGQAPPARRGRGDGHLLRHTPACGIGALDHVYLQLLEKERDEFSLMPFTCIVDPERMRMLMEGEGDINLPAEMRFLLDAQMAEADLIVLNKIDLLTPPEIEKRLALIRTLHPDTPVMTMSAKTGEGVPAVAEYLMTHEAAAEHREIGYGSEAFMAAERLLSWYNRRVFFEQREDKAVDFNAVIGEVFEGIREGLKKAGANVPHLKAFAAGAGRGLLQGQPHRRGLPRGVRQEAHGQLQRRFRRAQRPRRRRVGAHGLRR